MQLTALKPYTAPSTYPNSLAAATAELVAAAVTGDATATRALVVRLLPVIRARVRRGLGATQGLGCLRAGDLAQEMWLVLLKNDCAQLRLWDPARGATLEGYIGMIVDREMGNLRSQTWAKKRAGKLVHVESVDQLSDATPNPESVLLGRARAQTLWTHLNHTLPARGRAVLIQLCFEHNSPEQTADALGVDRQVVYNWRHEIRRKTRTFLFLEAACKTPKRIRPRAK